MDGRAGGHVDIDVDAVKVDKNPQKKKDWPGLFLVCFSLVWLNSNSTIQRLKKWRECKVEETKE